MFFLLTVTILKYSLPNLNKGDSQNEDSLTLHTDYLVFPIAIFPITFNSMITLFFFLSLASFLVFLFLIIVTAIIFHAGLYTDPWRCTKIRYIRLTTAILRVSCRTAKYEIRYVQSVLLLTSVAFFFPFLSTCQFDVQLFNLDSYDLTLILLFRLVVKYPLMRHHYCLYKCNHYYYNSFYFLCHFYVYFWFDQCAQFFWLSNLYSFLLC